MDEQASRYLIGIDLGTTNSAVTFVDTDESSWRVQRFPVAQLVDTDTVEARDTLPSFHFEPPQFTPAPRIWDEAGRQRYTVGFHARDAGSELPGRFISSAKSWLSHSGVDRTAGLLPWQAVDDIKRISPVEVTARLLGHIRNVWNHEHPKNPLEEQDVVITVPASFDEVARELTVEAARQIGISRLVLLEEPQAAFYAWMQRNPDHPLPEGHKILVIDVGGGTTDLSLIEVGAERSFRRGAVGDHLILGGDNLDLELAQRLEERLGRLKPRQWNVLVRKCRQAKEALLGDQAPASQTITLPGGGLRLIGGSKKVELQRDEALEWLRSRFLPDCQLGTPIEANAEARRSEFGLPFASDTAITRHLAHFIHSHGGQVDAVLFNGGFFSSAAFREDVLTHLSAWLGQRPNELVNPRLDLAVAEGASAYGMVRRGEGQAIEAGLARTYYIGVSEGDSVRALCLAPAGLQEGAQVTIPRDFRLTIKRPARFPIFVSSLRTSDQPGDLVDIDPNEIRALPPIQTVLQAGKKAKVAEIGVRISAELTAIGTLDVRCSEVDGERSWRLPFDVRSTTQTEVEAHEGTAEQEGLVDEHSVLECRALIQQCFRDKTMPPEQLTRQLEEVTGQKRAEWPTSLLRALWEETWAHQTMRQAGPVQEMRWLNLLGFSLRPGAGFAADDWRVDQTWRLFKNGVHHAKNEGCRADWWILWRRVAAGLSAGRQQELAAPLIASLKRGHLRGHEELEIWRLLGSLEWLESDVRKWLAEQTIGRIRKDGMKADKGVAIWTLARLASREPATVPSNRALPAEWVGDWVAFLIHRGETTHGLAFALMQMARFTDDRFRDLEEDLRERTAAFLEQMDQARYADLVRVGGQLDREDEGRLFGDALPIGLRID